ncbi:hypothetical protein [Paenibacillus sp. 23TSA30-6]|uniref:hypothetical protein n=1 Tax=Paenibacillus sp. 23TSA30-6 TaxID=2546104 RepID=UPI001788215D|nr:hypothetical protein [Paenibacillus sp. 23TSA30-6]
MMLGVGVTIWVASGLEEGEDSCVGIGRGKMGKPDQTVKGHVGLLEHFDYWLD